MFEKGHFYHLKFGKNGNKDWIKEFLVGVKPELDTLKMLACKNISSFYAGSFENTNVFYIEVNPNGGLIFDKKSLIELHEVSVRDFPLYISWETTSDFRKILSQKV